MPNTTTATGNSMNLDSDTVLEMANAGVLFGHRKSKTHPRMRPFIGGLKNEIELIDPEATVTALKAAEEAIGGVVERGELILTVGTLASARGAVERFAQALGFPYVTNRWLGGTLTNFKVITDRVKYYHELMEKKASGELAKYTKKEQSQWSKIIGKIAKDFSGLSALTHLPQLLLVVDPRTHETAIKEARTMKIPVVAILDTDDDPQGIAFPIYASDHAKSGIDWVMNVLTERAIAKRPRLAEEVEAKQAAQPAGGEGNV